MRIDVEDILRKDDQVGELANLERAFRFFAPAGKRRSERITINYLRHGQSLLGDKTCHGLTLGRLASHRGLNPFPRIESNDGPIAAESEAASRIRDALPGPRPGSPIRAAIPSPDVHRIGIRVRMERLHAGDDAEL